MPDLHSGNIITLSRLASWASLVPGHTKQQRQHRGQSSRTSPLEAHKEPRPFMSPLASEQNPNPAISSPHPPRPCKTVRAHACVRAFARPRTKFAPHAGLHPPLPCGRARTQAVQSPRPNARPQDVMLIFWGCAPGPRPRREPHPSVSLVPAFLPFSFFSCVRRRRRRRGCR